MKNRNLFVYLGLISVFLLTCSRPQQEPATSAYNIADILAFRREKDRAFRDNPSSPLLPKDRRNFQGLNYFPVDSTFRFRGAIRKYHPMPRDTIIGTGGELRPALKYGYFEFTYRGKAYRLQIYKMLENQAGSETELFLGFTDQTSGKTTYGGGRYINLEENPRNFYEVDFNLAYNPYCAYNPKYSCAVPPAENHLPFAVTAGEKIFKSH